MIPTALWVSIRAALCATAIVSVTGIALGCLLAKGRFRGRGIVEALCSLPVGLPPTVVGYYLLTQLGGPGPVRDVSIALLGHPLVFTFTGIVIAQTVESFPYCLRATRAAVAGVDPRLEQAARAIGLPEWRVLLQATLPLARRGIVAGVAMAFGRALGDYGATVAIAGGPGTGTMPIVLYNATFDGSADLARNLALIQVAVALSILVGVSRLGNAKEW
ncbi:MAG TPA: ABC transporter permease subunit [Solirubrobacteraceae bacterium]|nr:ABC transporter permease subunit [Solirubrobacteraceae bacterium]